MVSERISLYVEDPDKIYDRVYLSSEVYAQALEAFSIVCVDVGIIDRCAGAIYLAKRKSRPAQGWWWYIGGRVYAGEMPEMSATRCFKRETGLSIAPERFSFVRMSRVFFKDRAQPPYDKGCDSLIYGFALELTPEERAQVVLEPNEYESGGLTRFYYRDIIACPQLVPESVRDFCIEVFG